MSSRVGDPVAVGGLSGTLLATSSRGDGRHRVVSVRAGAREFVLKLYGRKRGYAATAARAFGHRFLVAKTGVGAAARFGTEKQLLALWRAHGFAVPELVALHLSPEPREPWLAMEWVPGPLVQRVLREPLAPAGLASLRRFASEAGRRHALAESKREPGLVHAHASFAHLIDRAGTWTYFDLEYGYTDASRVETLVAMELAGFVASLVREAGAGAPALVREFVAAYPERARLVRTLEVGATGRFPLVTRLAARLPALRGGARGRIGAGLAELERALG